MIEMGLIIFLDLSGDLKSPGIGIVCVSSSADEYTESSEMLLEIGEEDIKVIIRVGETDLFGFIEDSWWFCNEYLLLSLEFLLKDCAELVPSANKLFVPS